MKTKNESHLLELVETAYNRLMQEAELDELWSLSIEKHLVRNALVSLIVYLGGSIPDPIDELLGGE